MIGRPADGGGLDGQSLVRVLKRDRRLDREALYWHYPHYSNQGGVPSGAVRQGDFKLVEFYEDGRLELFNLREDLGETRNLAAANPGKTRELRQLLERWRRSVNATMPAFNPGYDAAKADQGLTGAQPPTR
jgi:arylsulfatase A-like enzyme